MDRLIAQAIALAKQIVRPLLVKVPHIRVVGRNEFGTVYDRDNPVIREAIVEDVGEAVVDEAGNTRLSTSKLTFLEAIEIDLMDLFIVHGEEVDVARREGLMKPSGDVTYYSTVYVGRRRP